VTPEVAFTCLRARVVLADTVDRRYRAGVVISAGGQRADRTVARGTLPSSTIIAACRSDRFGWRTLGFEATGPAGLLRSELQATAAFVFAQPGR